MTRASVRCRIGDRVQRLTTDGNAYSAGSTVKAITVDDVSRRCTVVLEDDDLSTTEKRGTFHKDGSVTLQQVRAL